MLTPKSLTISAIVTVTLALQAPLALANPAIIQDFKAHAQVLPRQALSAGYQRFGALDLGHFVAQVQGLRVRVKGQIAHKQKDYGSFLNVERDGAEWSDGSIALSAVRWPKTRPSAKPMLAMHEALGALRIEDDNFGCSGSIWALTDPATRGSMTREEIATFESYAERGCHMARGGGSTGVTGGGDDYNVIIRQHAMATALNEMSQARTQEERSAHFDRLGSTFYAGYGVNRRGKLIDPNFSLNVIKLQRRPGPGEFIRVFDDLDMQQEMPQNARNGWTYDSRTNTVTIHGRYRRGQFGAGPGVLITSGQ